MQEIKKKYELLKIWFTERNRVAVAFSGGVDSTLLLWAAREALGEQAIAISAQTAFFPKREQTEAQDFCNRHGIRQMIVRSNTLSLPEFRNNPPDRCYHCKKSLFTQFLEIAKQEGCTCIAEGSNLDDIGDYRPGLRAVAELGIQSPLREIGFTKAEIRQLSKELDLPTWEKPSIACLASRFVYGETITKEKLHRIDQAEQYLSDLGFRQVRVRIHGEMARIEVLPEDFSRLIEADCRNQILFMFQKIGFSYIAMDLQGYRTGSMNEIL